MQNIKRFGGLTLISIIISVIYAFLKKDDLLLRFNDCYFIIALFLFMVGSFMYVLDSGFFRNFSKANRKFLKVSIFKGATYEEESNPHPGQEFLYTWPFILSGVAGIVITYLIATLFL